MKNKKYIEIWGDMVQLSDLVLSILVISTTTMVSYSFAPSGNRPIELLLGLSGAILGFLMTLLFIKPKRTVQVMEDSHD